MSRALKALVLAAVVALVAGVAAWFSSKPNAHSVAADYDIGTITRGALALTVSATGTLSPLITVQVGSQVSGTLQHVYADFNSEVEKGDVIAQIEPSLFKATVAQERANYDTAAAEREKAAVTVRDNERQLRRTRSLRRSKMASESELDTAQYNYDAAVVDLKIKSAAVAQAKAALEHAKVNLAHTTIYAPIDGVVLSRDVDVGQTVAASLQAPTLFTIAQDLRRMQIETDVDEAFIGMVEEGQDVSFKVFAYPDRVFTGRLAQVRLSPRVESEVVLYNCIIHVDNTGLKLKPGMTATVTIEADRRDDVLKVPNAALRFVPKWPSSRLKALRNKLGLQADDALIWTLADDTPQPIKVRVGLVSDNETELHAPEIGEGMRVLLPAKARAPKRKRTTGLRLF
ncbi:MAG: efflux RND transporter periplasmic adaptor subunit [Gammaproteobacteria bacterium]|nr:efflux RND transporter periplasmic adaptor subunit [Gammaproteobacteria bacterium]